jgi:hypothetical protein
VAYRSDINKVVNKITVLLYQRHLTYPKTESSVMVSGKCASHREHAVYPKTAKLATLLKILLHGFTGRAARLLWWMDPINHDWIMGSRDQHSRKKTLVGW